MPTLRLDKIVAGIANYSRSEATAVIKQGRVAVGGVTALSGTAKIDPETEPVTIDGALVKYRRYCYLMMNKPGGYVSSTRDDRDRTVMELLDDKYRDIGLFPAGRLDKDAEGLLILTNDGDFAHMLTSPSKRVGKKYFVQIDDSISVSDIEAFTTGISLADGTKCLPAKLENTPEGVYVTLFEGKYHQVKRMMAAIGKPVKHLKRVAIGGLTLDDSLKPGDYCEIDGEILHDSLISNKRVK